MGSSDHLISNGEVRTGIFSEPVTVVDPAVRSEESSGKEAWPVGPGTLVTSNFTMWAGFQTI